MDAYTQITDVMTWVTLFIALLVAWDTDGVRKRIEKLEEKKDGK